MFLVMFSPLLLAGCGGDEAPATPEPQPRVADGGESSDRPLEGTTLTVYAGRKDSLVGPLVKRFETQSGATVNVKYGDDAALLATLADEAAAGRSGVDVYWANSVGALEEADKLGLLAPLSAGVTSLPAAFVPGDGRWLPITSRFRVLAIHPGTLAEADVPTSVMDLPKMTQLKGRIGWTPGYSSFQDFITAMRTIHGEQATLAWLEGMKALEPVDFKTNNGELVAKVASGELDAGLTNHYYVLRVSHPAKKDQSVAADGGEKKSEEEAAKPAALTAAAELAEKGIRIHHFAAGDVGNLALVTGAGVLESSEQAAAAEVFLQYLVSAEAQRYAAETVREYPVTTGIDLPRGMTPVDEALKLSPDFDFAKLSDIAATQAMLERAGLR